MGEIPLLTDPLSVYMFPGRIFPHRLQYCSCSRSFEIRCTDSFHFFFLVKIVSAILGTFTFHINFGMILFMSTKKHAEMLIGIVLEINLRRINMFPMLSLLIRET